MLDQCPLSWNLTSTSTSLDTGHSATGSEWWIHLDIYEMSYMWYSAVSCCLVIGLGSGLSLLPTFRQQHLPHSDLLVPVMEVRIRVQIIKKKFRCQAYFWRLGSLDEIVERKFIFHCALQVMFCFWPGRLQSALEHVFKVEDHEEPNGEEKTDETNV